MQINFDARLAASTVLVDGREWCQGTLTNLALNPSFEAAGSTVEVARNRFPNPGFRESQTGWGSSGTVSITRVTSANTVTGYALQAAYAVGSNHGVYTSTRLSAAAGDVIPVAFTHWGAVSDSFQIEMRFWNSVGTMLSQRVVPFTVTDAVTRTIASSGAAPAGTASMDIVLRKLSSSSAHTVFFGDFVTAANGAYFDGSYSPDPDLTPSWVSTVNNSASVLTAPRPANVFAAAPAQGQNYQTKDGLDGGNALRYVVYTQDPAGIPCVGTSVATTGTLYTMVMWVRASRAITVHPRVKGALAGGDGVALEPGVWTLVRTTVTAGAGSDNQTGLLLNTGAGHQYGDTIDVDDFTIVEGEHPDLMPFHGSTMNPDWPGVTYAWTGTPDASTSTRTTPAIDRIEVDRDPGTGWVPVRGGRRDVINGFVALTDHEMPLHQEVRYRVAGYSGSTYVGAFTGTVDTTIPGWCGVFVKIPANPNATVMVDPTNSIDIDSSTQGGSYDIAAGSSIAVAAWSGVNASRFTLNARTKTDVDSAQMRALLQKNRVILLQGPDWAPFPPGWYYVESVSEGLRGDGAIKQGRKWSLSLVSTGVPSGDTAGVAGASWNQIRAKYATWDELKTANSTWFDVLQGGN